MTLYKCDGDRSVLSDLLWKIPQWVPLMNSNDLKLPFYFLFNLYLSRKSLEIQLFFKDDLASTSLGSCKIADRTLIIQCSLQKSAKTIKTWTFGDIELVLWPVLGRACVDLHLLNVMAISTEFWTSDSFPSVGPKSLGLMRDRVQAWLLCQEIEVCGEHRTPGALRLKNREWHPTCTNGPAVSLFHWFHPAEIIA